MQGRKYSRRDMYNEIERMELISLPVLPYELKKRSIVTVLKTGHVCLGEDRHYYSVPHEYIGSKVSILYSQSRVEIYHKHQQIAFHQRNLKPYTYSTIDTHMASWQKVLTDWNPDKFIHWAAEIHEEVKHYISELINRKNYPEQAYKSCMGILSLAKKIGNERLINACQRGKFYDDYGYMAIKLIIEKGLDKTFDMDELKNTPMPVHENIRGEEYYN